jgi:hypothetical protein
MKARDIACTLLALTLAAGCGSGPGDEGGASLVMRVDTVGDTIVVRTERGSAWGGEARLEPVLRIGELEGSDEYVFGNIGGVALTPGGDLYVLDSQVPAVRIYDAAGRHVRSVGSRGGGPGELARPTGLALLPDGRVLVSDPANGRVNVYSASGDPLDSWRMSGGFMTSNQVVATAAGDAYVQALLSEPMIPAMRVGMVRTGPESIPADTIEGPVWDFEPPALTAEFTSGDSRAISRAPVPFGPQTTWTFSPLGYMVGGVSTRYAVEAFRPDGRVLRMERVVEPVPVTAGERAHREFTTTRNMRNTDPGWRWSGPPIPSTKAPFTSVRVDDDGRIWVRIAAHGEVVPPDEREEPRPGQEAGPEPWREPLVYDVFAEDGRLLGTLAMPARFTWYGSRGDRVWGITRDELDVQYATVLRLVTPAGDVASR